MRTAFVAIVLAAACGGGSKASTTPKATGPTCGAVADSMVAMMAEGKESTKAFVETKEGFTTIIRTRCEEDAWTADAKQCLAKMKSRDDAERCSTLLTETQQANLVRDQKAKFGAEPPPPEPTPTPATEPTNAAPPPTPAAAKPEPKPAEKAKKKSAPRAKKAPMPDGTRSTGDPCDGGE
jgi:outer membrane biosynthesis protein TonB